MDHQILKKNTEANPLAPTVFHEDWWLDAATQGRYKRVEQRENGRIIATLPYVTTGPCATMRRIVMPMLTHFLGPVVIDGDGSSNTKLARRIDLTRAMIGQLPATLSTIFKCHAGVSDTIAFQMEGFRTTVQYTYEIAPQNPDDVWAAMRSPRRTIIRGAQKQCAVERLDDPNAFMRFYDDNLRLTGKDSFLDSSVCIGLIEETLRRGRGSIYAARHNGSLAGAIFCVWDARASYYLMTTRHPSSHSGVVSLLTYEAIRDAMARGLIFDLDGLCDAGGVAFFTGFGGSVAPRFIVTREAAPMKLYRALRSVLGKESTYA